MTPYLLIDESRMMRNLAEMQDLATKHGVHLRPHVKTHKSFEIARRQLDAGASGLTVSQPYEALAFLRAGFPSITMAYPVVDVERLKPVLSTARDLGAAVTIVLDSVEGAEAAGRAASKLGVAVDALIEIDVGLHRCGVSPDGEDLAALVASVRRATAVNLAGIISHAGQAYGAASFDEVRSIAETERSVMSGIHDRLSASFGPLPVVSVGSTPTVRAAESFTGITEIRPGNYVFLDRTQWGLGIGEPDRIALTVRTTIVSRNDRCYIVDAGSKVLSSDRGAQGGDSLKGYGVAFPATEEVRKKTVEDCGMTVTRLSEEHGFVERAGTSLAIGDELTILPNHACVVANLAPEYVVRCADGVLTSWEVDARRTGAQR